jgi:hypothetical protein
MGCQCLGLAESQDREGGKFRKAEMKKKEQINGEGGVTIRQTKM